MKKVLFVVGDSYNTRFDPRILGQAHIFRQKNWAVTILCTSDTDKSKSIISEGIRFICIHKHEQFWYLTSLAKFLKAQKLLSFLTKLSLKIKYEINRFRNLIKQNSVPRNELKYLRKIKTSDKYDLIIACDITSYLTSKKLSNRHHSPFWLDLHEYFSAQNIPSHRSAMYKILEQEAIKKAARTYTVNPLLARKISLDYDLPFEMVEWLPNAAMPGKEIGFGRGIFNEVFDNFNRVVIYNGTLSDDRNLEKLPHLARSLLTYDIAVVVVGPGNPENYFFSPPSNFFYFSPLETDEMKATLRSFNGILMPNEVVDINNQLCFPNKFGDALQCHIPVIVNEGLEFLESVIEEFEIGIVINFKDIDNAATKIASFLENDYRSGFYNKAEAKYGWPAFESKFSHWIDQFSNQYK